MPTILVALRLPEAAVSDLLPGLREKISDAAYEYQQYIDTDHAHINLTAYMEQAFDNALRELERAQNAGAEPAPATTVLVPLTEEEIEQVYEDARDHWLNDSEARGEMRELGIPPEADAVVKCDMKTLRALCDLALAGLRARDEALEEAAKRVEREFVGHYLGNTAAHLIRALKGTP